MALKVGQRVTFRPTHHKELELTGKVVKLYKGTNAVDVKSDAGNGSVSRIYAAHLADCAPIEEEEAAAVSAEEEQRTDAEEETGTETEESGAE